MVPGSPPSSPLAPQPEDPFAAQRERLMYGLTLLGTAFLLPFAVNNFFKGRIVLGFAVVAVVITLGVDGLALHLKRRPPIPYGLLVLPMAGAIMLSIAVQGVIGAFWCYPAVVFLYFVLPRRAAILGNGALLLAASAMAYVHLGLSIAIRFTVSLTLTVFIITIIQNVIRDLQERLLDQAITDPLTGAFNRRYMEGRLAEAVERRRRTAATSSLLIIDVDHFKRINDDLGHETGDGVLKGIVSIVQKRSRKGDLLFRIGGEEFLLLLPDTAEENALRLADELRASIEAYPLLAGRPVTVSIGTGEVHADETVDSWIQHADSALYSAKQSGRNRVARRQAAGDDATEAQRSRRDATASTRR